MEGKEKFTPANRPCALKKGPLTHKLARVSPRALKPKLDTASLGESQKQSLWRSGGLSTMLLDAWSLLLLLSIAAQSANPLSEFP
eukprot:1156244-Pelagomonas_calceolata.AAC.2